jgi:hypothetical protein
MAQRKIREERTNVPQSVVRVGESAPSWLQNYQEVDNSFEGLEQYRVLPRLKIVQGTSNAKLQQSFNAGTVIIIPSMQVLAHSDESFRFVPIFGFTEFRLWSDLKDEQSPAIVERTFDKKSELAQKARDPSLRQEPYGDLDTKTGMPRYSRRYVEHICFACMIHDRESPFYGTPMVLEFARGEFGRGTQFVSSMMLRRYGGKPVPMFGQVWEATPAFRENGPQKKWWGLDINSPSDVDPYVTEEEFQFFADQHRSLRADFDKKILVVNTVDAEDVAESEFGAADTGTVEADM